MIMLALLLSQTGSEPERGADYAHYNRFTKFDQYFSKYSKRHFGVGFDWRYFKAQAVAESNLRPAVTSRAGVVGVMQIMPRTYEEIRSKNPGIRGSAEQPRWNIAAGIWYDRQNFVVWTERRPLLDKIKFMFGSYNAGRASILPGAAGRGGRRAGRHALVGDRAGPAPCHRPKQRRNAAVCRPDSRYQAGASLMDAAIVVINFLYALVGACLTITFMALGFKVFDRMTPFDTHDELAKGNIAVGSRGRVDLRGRRHRHRSGRRDGAKLTAAAVIGCDRPALATRRALRDGRTLAARG